MNIQRWIQRFRKQEAEEGEAEAPPAPSLPLDIDAISLPELVEQACFKDLFQFLFNEDKTRLYILLRDQASAEQHIEGRIPVVVLDEKHIAHHMMLLRGALAQMHQAQIERNALTQWTLMSPETPKPDTSVTSVSTPEEERPAWQRFDPPSDAFLEGEKDDEDLPFSDDEEEDGENEDKGNFNIWQTDDGYGYS